MKFVVNKEAITREFSQEFVVPATEEGEEEIKFTVHFKFPFAEEREYGKDYAELVNSVSNSENPEEDDFARGATIKISLKEIRQAIVGWDGIVDENGEALPVTEENQKAIHEVIRNLDQYNNVVRFKNGLTSKNSKTGAK